MSHDGYCSLLSAGGAGFAGRSSAKDFPLARRNEVLVSVRAQKVLPTKKAIVETIVLLRTGNVVERTRLESSCTDPGKAFFDYFSQNIRDAVHVSFGLVSFYDKISDQMQGASGCGGMKIVKSVLELPN
jgi:hypothetical protein